MAKQRTTAAMPFMPMPGNQPVSSGYATPTGGAVVFGQPQAAANFPQQVNYLRQQQQLAQAERDQYAQRMAQSWRDNALEASAGQLWANQLGQIENEHVAKGQQLMQRNINPYESNHPDAIQYRRERREIEAQRQYRQGVESQYNNLIKQMQQNPNRYNPRDVEALNQWVSQGNISDYYRTNAQLPQLRERFDLVKTLSGVKASVTDNTTTQGNIKRREIQINRPETEQAILSTLMNSPGGAEYVAELTGGMPIQEIRRTPDTLDGNLKLFDNLYDGDPELREQLAAQYNITSKSDPQYSEVARLISQQRLNAKRNFDSQMSQLVARASGGIRTGVTETPDFTAARFYNERERLELAKRREKREAGGSLTPQDYTVTNRTFYRTPYDQQGNPLPEETVATFDRFVAANPTAFGTSQLEKAYDVSQKAQVRLPANKSVELVGVGYTDVGGNGKKKMAVIVDSDNNEYFIDIEDVPVKVRNSKDYMTADQALGSGTSDKSATRSQIKSLVGQPGYEGYSEQELIDYYKSQGYDIK